VALLQSSLTHIKPRNTLLAVVKAESDYHARKTTTEITAIKTRNARAPIHINENSITHTPLRAGPVMVVKAYRLMAVAAVIE